MPSPERVREFISLVERGEYVRAIEHFYHPDASMQERTASRRALDDTPLVTKQGVRSKRR